MVRRRDNHGISCGPGGIRDRGNPIEVDRPYSRGEGEAHRRRDSDSAILAAWHRYSLGDWILGFVLSLVVVGLEEVSPIKHEIVSGDPNLAYDLRVRATPMGFCVFLSICLRICCYTFELPFRLYVHVCLWASASFLLLALTSIPCAFLMRLSHSARTGFRPLLSCRMRRSSCGNY